MAVLYMLIGIPGSGKSTWAKKMQEEQGAYWVSRDKIRFQYIKDEDDYFAYEERVFDEFVEEIQNAIYDKFPIIIADATHLNLKARNKVLRRLSLLGTRVEFVYFNVDLQTALERNAQRQGRARVPDSVIMNMQKSIQLPADVLVLNEKGELHDLVH